MVQLAVAQALHLAPPTVSLHIHELEARLGMALLLRDRKGARPTPAGLALVEDARRLGLAHRPPALLDASTRAVLQLLTPA